VPRSDYQYRLDRRGRVLVVHTVDGVVEDVTDLEGAVPRELQGVRLEPHVLGEVEAPAARGEIIHTRSYRSRNRFFVQITNASRPGNEEWWFVPGRGRVLGYDKQSKRLIGTFGPDGFLPPDDPAGARFEGRLDTGLFTPDYLAFPGGVYAVDFRTRTVRTLFVPEPGESVLWASRWEDGEKRLALAFVGTDRSVHVVDEGGSRMFAAPRVHDPEGYRILSAGRLEDPLRYWVWYEPEWYLGMDALETMPSYVLEYDVSGREVARRAVPPRPGGARQTAPPLPAIEPSPALVAFGPVTPPAGAAILVGSTWYLVQEVRKGGDEETGPLLWFLLFTTQFFLPGVRWDPHAHAGLVVGHVALMLASAVACALVCFLLARRHAFSPARRAGWSLCGLLWGPVGLMLMLALEEWPARVACPRCRKPRVVTQETCEHCGAPHAAPAPDGTEIFEEDAAAPHEALAGR
jgi:hypothetical protein